MAQLVRETYAQALFEAAVEQDVLQSTFNDYRDVIAIFKSEPEFFELYKTPKIDKEEKKQILESVFGQHIQKELLNFLKVLVDKRRTFYVSDIFDAFDTKYREHLKMRTAIVKTVTPMTSEQMDLLAKKLSEQTGLKVHVENILDESIMGGMLIQMGDQVLDSTLKRKLGNLKETLSQLVV
jgi:F-type H+-transporting ATPase subunit delta